MNHLYDDLNEALGRFEEALRAAGFVVPAEFGIRNHRFRWGRVGGRYGIQWLNEKDERVQLAVAPFEHRLAVAESTGFVIDHIQKVQHLQYARIEQAIIEIDSAIASLHSDDEVSASTSERSNEASTRYGQHLLEKVDEVSKRVVTIEVFRGDEWRIYCHCCCGTWVGSGGTDVPTVHPNDDCPLSGRPGTRSVV